jgi:hypothetical protein
MSLANLFLRLQETGWATALRESEWTYPIVLSLHLSAIAFFGGLILMTNLRLLGLAWQETPVETVVRQLRPWKCAGFLLIVTCGALLASAKAATYYPNPYFRVKMSLLALVGVHAFVFRRGVYDGASGSGSGKPRLAAYLSLALWVGILSMGRWIAYYDAPKQPANQSGIAPAFVARTLSD